MNMLSKQGMQTFKRILASEQAKQRLSSYTFTFVLICIWEIVPTYFPDRMSLNINIQNEKQLIIINRPVSMSARLPVSSVRPAVRQSDRPSARL